jgi:hypothetical protein
MQEISVPARLKVERAAGELSVSYDPASFHKVPITAGDGMIVGFTDVSRLYHQGGPRPAEDGTIRMGTIIETNATMPMTGASTIPDPGDGYVIEHDITVFETDIPPGPRWNPLSGKYRVLWEEKLTILR